MSVCKHRVSCSISLPSRGSFHLSLTVLIAIGHQVVFSLMGWSPHFHTRFHVPRITLDTILLAHLSYTGLSPSMVCFSKTFLLNSLNRLCSPNPTRITSYGLGSSYFARHYSRNRLLSFFSCRYIRCFSSLRSLPIHYFTHVWIS